MSIATERLAAYRAAELAVLKGQSFTIDGTQMTRADLAKIQEGLASAKREVADEQRAAAGQHSRAGYAVASFNDR